MFSKATTLALLLLAALVSINAQNTWTITFTDFCNNAATSTGVGSAYQRYIFATPNSVAPTGLTLTLSSVLVGATHSITFASSTFTWNAGDAPTKNTTFTGAISSAGNNITFTTATGGWTAPSPIAFPVYPAISYTLSDVTFNTIATANLQATGLATGNRLTITPTVSPAASSTGLFFVPSSYTTFSASTTVATNYLVNGTNTGPYTVCLYYSGPAATTTPVWSGTVNGKQGVMQLDRPTGPYVVGQTYWAQLYFTAPPTTSYVVNFATTSGLVLLVAGSPVSSVTFNAPIPLSIATNPYYNTTTSPIDRRSIAIRFDQANANHVITYTVTGDTAAISTLLTFSNFSVSPITLSVPTSVSLGVVGGVPSGPFFASLNSPYTSNIGGSLTLTPIAQAGTTTVPSSLTFSNSVTKVAFWISNTNVQTNTNNGVNITWSVSDTNNVQVVALNTPGLIGTPYNSSFITASVPGGFPTSSTPATVTSNTGYYQLELSNTIPTGMTLVVSVSAIYYDSNWNTQTSQLQFSPSTLTYNAGDVVKGFQVSIPNNAARGWHNVSFALSGSAGPIVNSSPLGFYVAPSNIWVPSVSVTLQVGKPYPLVISVDYAPASDVTLNILPFTSELTSGITASPSRLTFSPTTLSGVIYLTAAEPVELKTSTTVQYQISGTNAAAYVVSGTTTIAGTLRVTKLTINSPNVGSGSNLFLGQTSAPFYINMDLTGFNGNPTLTPGFSGVSVQLSSDYVTFSPSVISWAPGDNPQKSFTVTGLNPGSSISPKVVVLGNDAEFFNTPTWPLPLTISQRSANLEPTAITVIPNVASDPIDFYLSLPVQNGITYTPQAGPGITFNPTALVFNAGDVKKTFTVTVSDTVSSTLTSGGFDVLWVASGQDISQYSTVFATVGAFLTAHPATFSVSGSPISVTLGVPHVVSFVVSSLTTDFTFTPTVPGGTFTPTSITVPAGIASSYTVTSTVLITSATVQRGTVSLPLTISVSGDAFTAGGVATVIASFNLVRPTVTLSGSPYTSFQLSSTSTTSTEGFVTLSSPVTNSLTVNIGTANSAVWASPNVITFTAGDLGLTKTFTFIANAPVSKVPVYLNITGPDASFYDQYISTGSELITVSPITLTAPTLSGVSTTDNYVGVPVSILHSGTDYYGAFTFSLSSPAEVTIMPTSTKFTFSPTSFVFTGGNTLIPFTLTPNYVDSTANSAVSFNIGGTDAAWIDTTSISEWFTSFVVNRRPAPVFSSSPITLIPGTPQTVQIRVQFPSWNGLTVQPQSHFVSFSPSSVTFNATTTAALFTLTTTSQAITALVESTISETVQLAYSGPDANWYTASSLSVSIQKKIISVTAPSSLTLAVGVPSDVFTVIIIGGASESSVTVTPISPDGSLNFNPSSLTFSSTSPRLYFTATPNTNIVSKTSIQWSITGSSASEYSLPNVVSPITIAQRSITVNSLNNPDFVNLSDGVTTSPIDVTLSYPTSNGVTVNIVSSSACTFSPSALTFAPGSTRQWFTVVCQNNFVDTTGSTAIQIQFYLSGADVLLYAAPPTYTSATFKSAIQKIDSTCTSVTLNLGETSTSCYVSLSNPNIPVNDLTLSFSVSVQGLTFSPSTIVFNNWARIAYFNIKATGPALENGANPFTYTVTPVLTGKDSLNVIKPSAITVQVNKKTFSYGGIDLIRAGSAPVQAWITLSELPSDMSNSVTISIAGDSTFTIAPSTLTFSSTSSSATQYFTLSSSAPHVSFIDFIISGPGAYAYTPVTRANINVLYRSALPPTVSSVALKVGVPSNPLTFVLRDAPVNGLSVTITGNNLVANPPTLTFASGQTVQTFTVTSNFVQDTSASVPEIFYTFGGADAGIYNTSVSSSVSTFSSVSSLQVTVSYSFGTLYPNVQTGPFTVAVDYLPQSDITVTPIFPWLQFNPSSITFTPTSNKVQSFYVTNTGPLASTAPNVYYSVTGTNANWYSSLTSSTSSGSLNSFSSTFFSVSTAKVGAQGLYSIQLHNPSWNGVTLTPHVSGNIVFTPSSFVFPAYVDGSSLLLEFNVQYTGVFTSGSAHIEWQVSGPDANLFTLPNDQDVAITSNTITPTWSASSVSSGVWLEKNYITITGTVFPANGLIVTFGAVGGDAQFDPPYVTFGADSVTASFRVKAWSVGTLTITYTLSGPSAFMFATPSTSTLTINSRLVSPGIYTSNGPKYQYPTVTIGGNSFPSDLSVSLDVAPVSSSLTVTPTAPGIVFNPSTWVFAPGQQQASFKFTVLSSVTSSQTVTYLITGAESLYYTINPNHVATISITSVSIVSASSISNPTIVVGIPFGPLVYTLSGSTPNWVSLSFSSPDLTFTPPGPWNISNSQSTVSFMVTALRPSSSAEIIAVPTISGPDAHIFSGLANVVFTARRRNMVLISNGAFSTFTIGVPSAPLAVTLEYPTTNGVSLNLDAIDTTFSPSPVLSWTSASAATQTFTYSSLNAQNPLNVMLSVTGPDADWYQVVDSTSGSAIAFVQPQMTQREVIITYPSSVDFNAPFLVTVSLQFAPITGLTVWLNGAFTFSQQSVTFTPTSDTTALVWVTPNIATGTYSIIPTLSGPDASIYYISNAKGVAQFLLNIVINPLSFTNPTYTDTLYMGLPAAPRTMAVIGVPSDVVYVTPSSPYLTFNPPVFTFSPTQLSQVFTFQLTDTYYNDFKSDGALHSTISYQISGPAAHHFTAPVDVTNPGLKVELDPFNGLSLSIIGIGNNLPVGTPGSFVVGVNDRVLSAGQTLIVTPYSYFPGLTFSPTSVTFTGSSFTSQTETFTVWSLAVRSSVVVQLALSGNAASFFVSDNYKLTFNFIIRSISLSSNVANSASTVVGVPQTATLVLSQPTINGLTVNLLTNSLSLSTNTLTFAPGQDVAQFTFTPNQFGTNILNFVTGGPDADLYAVPASYSGTAALRTISTTSQQGTIYQGSGLQYPFNQYIYLSQPSINGLTITPIANGLTFQPTTVTIAPGSSSGILLISSTTQTGSGSYTINYLLGGADANIYSPPATITFTVTPNNYGVQYPTTITAGETVLLEVHTLVPPLNGVTIIPTAANVIFNPTEIVIPAGATGATFQATFLTVGEVRIFYTNAGPDALQYRVYNYNGNVGYDEITVQPRIISWNFEAYTNVVGTTSPYEVALYLSTNEGLPVSPVNPVTITMVSSPPNAITFNPSSVTINSTTTSASFTYSISPSWFNFVNAYNNPRDPYINFVVTSQDSAWYQFSGGNSYQTIEVIYRSFNVPDYENIDFIPYQTTSNPTNFFPYGQTSRVFSLTAVGGPSDVSVTLSCDIATITPNVLTFNGQNNTQYFTITGTSVGTGAIHYYIWGTDANLFLPIPPDFIVVTYHVEVAPFPTTFPGQLSKPVRIQIAPTPTTQLVVDFSADNGIFFSPSDSVIIPAGTNTTWFQASALSALATRAYFNVREQAQGSPWCASYTGQNCVPYTPTRGAYIVTISPVGFIFNIPPNLALGATREFQVTTEAPPINGVSLTPYGNNLIFTPSTWVFTPTSYTITVLVKSVNSHSDPLKDVTINIDWDVEGYDGDFFLSPQQSYVYIAPPPPGSYEADVLSGAESAFASALVVATLTSVVLLLL